MARTRRGVKFPHKANGHGEGRRSSFSDVSEDGSPTKQRSGAALDNIVEVSSRFAVCIGTALVRLPVPSSSWS